MESYPAELVTPPLALVALLGSQELHAQLGEFLRSHHKPPINSMGVADPLAVGRVFGRAPDTYSASTNGTNGACRVCKDNCGCVCACVLEP